MAGSHDVQRLLYLSDSSNDTCRERLPLRFSHKVRERREEMRHVESRVGQIKEIRPPDVAQWSKRGPDIFTKRGE
jgi:hypothetical protein